MTTLEKAARALADLDIRAKRKWDTSEEDLERLLPGGIDYCWREYQPQALAVLNAIREPSDEAVAAVVQKVGDPSPDNWAQAERVVVALSGPDMDGETACAELARDWVNMIDQILSEAA